jgi:hypothetical protein
MNNAYANQTDNEVNQFEKNQSLDLRVINHASNKNALLFS